MKIVRNILLCFTLLLAFSCETYKDYEIEYSPVYPIAGEWIVTYTDLSVTPNVTSNIFVLSTYNTADNSKNQMWIRSLNHNLLGGTPPMGRFTGKIDCNVTDKSFSGTGAINTSGTGSPLPTFNITEGKVELGAYETLTKGMADKITFKMTDTRRPGKEYLVTGFRRTRWLADEGL